MTEEEAKGKKTAKKPEVEAEVKEPEAKAEAKEPNAEAEVKEPEAKEPKTKAEAKEPKAKAGTKSSAAVEAIMTSIKKMNVLELSELVKALQAEFGVSAPVAVKKSGLIKSASSGQ